MASFSALRSGIATRLATISGLNVHGTVPGQINAPAAIVLPDGAFLDFDATMGRGSDNFRFTVRLFVAKTTDQLAQSKLDPYLAGSGSSSVKAAIEGDGTLGGIASFTVVTGAQGYGEYEFAEISYLGCEFTVEVTA